MLFHLHQIPMPFYDLLNNFQSQAVLWHGFFLYVENHSLGEWFQRRLMPVMKREKLLLL